MTMKMKLYYRPTCPFCYKVQSFLEAKAMEVDSVDVSEDEKALQELVDVGGKQQVPCLIVDGEAMYESDDIIAWLEENYQR